MRTLSMAVKPLVLAVCGAVALYGCLGGGGGGGVDGSAPSSGVNLGVDINQSLIDKAPIRLICTADGKVLGTGVTNQGSYSFSNIPTTCAGLVLVELDVTNLNASYDMAGPDNVFGTGDDEVYKPSERMQLKALVDLTGSTSGSTVSAHVSPITTAVTNSALKLATIPTAPTAANVTTASASVATALNITNTDFTKADPRRNTEVAEMGTKLAAAVFMAAKATGNANSQSIVDGIALNINNSGAAINGDITRLSSNADVTAAITAAKPLIDAEAKTRKAMVDAMQLMGVTDLPINKRELDALLIAKKLNTTVVREGLTTTVADVAAVFQARQKESVVIAAAQKYMQDSVTPGATAGVEMSKVVGAAVALVEKADSFVTSTANDDAKKQVAAQQDVMKNIMAVVAANVAKMNTDLTSISTPSAAAKVVASAQQIVADAANANEVGAFATPAAVGGQPGTFDTTKISGVNAEAINASLAGITTVQEFVAPDVKDSSNTKIDLDAAKITDPGPIEFVTKNMSASNASDVIESDEITVGLVNTQVLVQASGPGVSLAITNASGEKTVLKPSDIEPFETPKGYVAKGDKVKLLIKSPPVAQTATRESVTATLLLGKNKQATDPTEPRKASMTVQGPAGVVPGTPSGISVEVTDGSATVTFTAPSAGSAQITEYTVTATPVGGGTPITVTGAGTQIIVTGLTNGTAYTFTVSAKNGVGSGTASSQSQSFTPATAPSAPTVSSVTGGNGQATVNFTAPSSDGGAEIIEYTVTSTPGEKTATANGTARQITITGLTNGIAYTFMVKAKNARGITSALSASSNPVTPVGPPSAPTIASAVAGDRHVVIGFTAPTNSGGATITGYTVTATPAGGGTPIAATGTASPISVTGLTNGTAYTITVKANNSAGSGATSASVSATPATLPGAPTSVSASAGDGLAVVSFIAPSSNGGSAILDYTVTATPTSGGSAETKTKTDIGTSITVTGLTNGTPYTFTVVARNAKGPSAASSPASVTPAAAPGAPSGVTAVAGSGSATVSFTAPASTGGATIIDYTVTASPGGQTATGSTTPITISGLTNGTSYTFTVKARTSAGLGVASAASSPVTPATVPGAPTGVTAVAGNGTATVSFTAPSSNGGSAITLYTATSNPGGLTGTSTTAIPITVSGLTNGTAYTFTVMATNAKGSTASSASSSVTPVALPGAPTGVGAVAGNGSATVTFTAPTSTGGATITGYTVTSSPGGLTGSGTGSPITVNGLTNGTAYTFTVRATSSAGAGPFSTATTAVTPATVPGAPTGVTAVAGNGTATVSFAAPSSNGGSAITLYTVTSNPGGLTNTSTTVSPITISGLTNGTAYTFTVVAANAKGSTASSASGSVTPAAPVTVFTATSGTLTDGQGLFKKLATSAETVTFSITVSGVGTTAKSFTAGGFSGLVTVNGATVDPEDPASALAKDGDVIQVKVKASTVSHKLAVASVNFLNAQAQAIAPTYWAGVCTGSLPNSFGTPPDIPAGSPFPSTCPAS